MVAPQIDEQQRQNPRRSSTAIAPTRPWRSPRRAPLKVAVQPLSGPHHLCGFCSAAGAVFSGITRLMMMAQVAIIRGNR